MNIKSIFTNKYVRTILLIAVGILLGRIFFRSPEHTRQHAVHNHAAPEATAVWTCSMHPQIRAEKPGKCPLCAMDLTPVSIGNDATDPDALEMTEEAMRLADVQTTAASAGSLAKQVRLYGKIQADERAGLTLAAHFPGRIDQLKINATGETVRKGQAIASVYSPELVTAQNDLLQALSMGDRGITLAEAARRKLKLWKLSDEQISTIEQSGNIQTVFESYSDLSGVIIAKRVNEGDYVMQGAPLFDVSDLNRVWILFDAYEDDLPWIKKGDKIRFTVRSLPGKEYEGRVAFIDPVLDTQTRTAKVRVEYGNADGAFKPGMFVTGIAEESCIGKNDRIAIPNSAVLWTGTRSIVYVKDPETEKPTFRMREITLGVSLGDMQVIESGLEEGEEVVVNGAFEIDASAQLAGKPGMMNPPAGKVDATMSEEPNITMLNLDVPGLCSMCKKNIETAAQSVSGVRFAEWTAEKQNVHLLFDKRKTNRETVEKAIAAAGYDTEHFKAPDEVYEQLAPCCHYREK